MIRAAIYARFSSDNQRENSIEDQLRNCRERAESEGWEIVAEYKDQALSGKLRDRPGFIQLMQSAESSDFQVLIADDLSRLTRGVNASSIVEQMHFHGVRLVTISDGIDSDNKTAKLAVGLKGMMNNMFLDNLKDSVHRGLKGNALKGKNTGGKAFGYKVVPVFSETEVDVYGRPEIAYSDMEINEEQAKSVRQVFQWVIEKRSYRWIANELNRLCVPTLHGGNWTTSTICGNSQNAHTGILNNPIYIGKKYWNRTEQIHNPVTGKSCKRERDENEWVCVAREDLRIIDDETWELVKKEQARRYQKTAAKIAQTGNKGARTGAGSKFLLSGILKCSECGSNYIIVAPGKYGCGSRHKAGESVCANNTKISQEEIEASVIDSMRENLFSEDVINEFRGEVAKLIKARKADLQPAIRSLEAELKSIENSIQKLIAYIVSLDDPPASISAEINKLEQKRASLAKQVMEQ